MGKLEIKGIELGQGQPVICVSVLDSKKEDIVNEVKRLVSLGVKMVEWRVDAFEGIESLNAIREVLQELKQHVTDTILVYTFRSKKQGGLKELDYERVYDIRQVAAESKVVDFVDVEYFDVDDMEREIYTLQKMGVKVITSHHDFFETPSGEVVTMLLEQMAQSNADIVKLAVMPQCPEDVLVLLRETTRFHEKYPNQPLITMSMGKLGAISRMSGEIFGSCVTFAAGKMASAPGQVSFEKLQQVLDIISG